MATNREEWTPTVKSRICDKHFCIDDFESGNKKNRLKPFACPIINADADAVEGNPTVSDSDGDVCSTSDVNLSDIDSEDLPDTPNTSDMKFSDDDLSLTSLSDSNSDGTIGINDLLSFSENELNEDRTKINKSTLLDDLDDAVSLSSSATSLIDANLSNDRKCAVALCNEKARQQFDRLFFINFPKSNVSLCESWWKLCGRNGNFDPSLKICSIHFAADDFMNVTERRDGRLYRQTLLKNSKIVPTLYLKTDDFTKFSRKRKNSSNVDNNSTKCAVQNCSKTSVKDGNHTLFFRFPLENKTLLQEWINKLKLSNWQPSKTDRICSDHFENNCIRKVNNKYELVNRAIPSIKSDNSQIMGSKNLNKEKSNKFLNKKNKYFDDFKFNSLNKDNLMVQLKNKKSENPQSVNLLRNKNLITTLLNPTTSRSANQDDRKKTKLTMNTINNNLNKMSTNVSNVYIDNDTISPKPSTSKVTQSSFIESSKFNVSEASNMIPKSINNGNDRDYVYLDALNGDDVGKYLSFEKPCTPSHSRQAVSDLLKKSDIIETPTTIILNEDLTEIYGEMLPPYCDPSCKFMCSYFIPGPRRKEIFDKFRALDGLTEQNCEIAHLVQLRMIKKGNSFESSPSFHLAINFDLIKVCQPFFINTLGIPENRLNAVLNPFNYSWFSDKDTAIKANLPRQEKLNEEDLPMTNFVAESLVNLDKDYNLFEPESDTEFSLENVSSEEYEKVFLFIKSVPRILSSYKIEPESRKQYFETSICLDYMYKMYSENYIKESIPPPFTMCQFKKIYNQYMKTFLQMI